MPIQANNDDVAELATTLSQLESLILGPACSENTCATTVACLLQISVHCIRLEKLAIRFNTTNIVDDFRDISKGHRFQELHSLPRCTLSCLDISQIPLKRPNGSCCHRVYTDVSVIATTILICEQ